MFWVFALIFLQQKMNNEIYIIITWMFTWENFITISMPKTCISLYL